MLLVRIAEGPEYQLDLDTCFVIDSEKKEIFQPRVSASMTMSIIRTCSRSIIYLFANPFQKIA